MSDERMSDEKIMKLLEYVCRDITEMTSGWDLAELEDHGYVEYSHEYDSHAVTARGYQFMIDYHERNVRP